MGKKHKHPEHENHERWLVSYADFITLLFATFTALYAMASNDLVKMKDVGQAIQEGFQQQSLLNGIKSILQGKSPPQDNPNPLSKREGMGAGVIGKYDSLSYRPGEVKKFDQAVHNLESDIRKINQQIKLARQAMQSGKQNGSQKSPDSIALTVQERGIKVSFDSSLLFEPGSATLTPSAMSMLDLIGQRLKPLADNHLIKVEGHTDNTPILTAVYPSNWELSTARSSRVIRYLISKHGYLPALLSAVGFSDSHPITTNATAEGRQKNRRIDIILSGQVERNNPDMKESSVPEDNQIVHSESSTPLPNGAVRVILKSKSGLKIIKPTQKENQAE